MGEAQSIHPLLERQLNTNKPVRNYMGRAKSIATGELKHNVLTFQLKGNKRVKD